MCVFSRADFFALFVIFCLDFFESDTSQGWLALAPACVKWRHERRGGMVEQCLSLQWGVLPTGDTHTHIEGRAHTHTRTHLAMVVHVQLHKQHLSDCSAETSLAVTPPRTPFCGGAHHDQNYDVDTNKCPKCSAFTQMMRL